jgi:enoyl-CoA hydratase/carnithine racemase
MRSEKTGAVTVLSFEAGRAIAGGCVLALQADFRVMSLQPAKIGLNEISLGVGLPAEVIETARCQLPPASFASMCLTGVLLSPVLRAIAKTADGALEAWLETWFSAATRERLVAAVAALKRK